MFTILISVVVIGFLLVGIFYYNNALPQKDNEVQTKEITQIDDGCCGAHVVCERDSLLSAENLIFYFDDEELDNLAGKAIVNFTETDIQQLFYVFSTLNENDVAGWLRSLQLRNIQLPSEIREQALLIVSERRQAASHLS